MRMRTIAGLSMVTMLLFAPGFANAGDDLATKIAAAKTAADHEAIAAAYDKEAAEAAEKAKMHEKMGASYTGALKEKVHLDEHCRVIAKGYSDQAKEFEALAKAHRDQAKSAK